ncbi:MAG: ATP-binding protein [archaeon]
MHTIAENEYGKILQQDEHTFLLQMQQNARTDDCANSIDELAHELVRHIDKTNDLTSYLADSGYGLCTLKYFLFAEHLHNAQKYGNKHDPSKTTTIDYTFNKQQAELSVTITDEGEGFDYRRLVNAEKAARNNPAQTYNDVREEKSDGAGFSLFHSLRFCDSVSWNEQGNSITLKKTLKDLARQ